MADDDVTIEEVPRGAGGRPSLLDLDERTLRQIKVLSGMQCTQAEAAAALGVSTRTFKYFLDRHPQARQAWEDGVHFGKASLKRAQYEVAVKDKNVQMLIWLGKNLLGQTDKQETTHRIDNITPEERLKRIKELQEKAMLPAPEAPEEQET